MSIYDAGHQFYLRLAKESGTITESTDGTTEATLPTAPSNPRLVGYIDPADVTRNENTKQGWGAGSPDAAYTVLGARTFMLNLNIRVGDLTLLEEAFEDNEEYAIFYGKTDENGDGWGKTLRFAKITSITLSIESSEEEAQEISAQVAFEAIAWELDTDKFTVSLSGLQTAGGDVLTWYHVITAKIDNTDYRQGITGITITKTKSLQCKPGRPDWGDDEVLSRTSYALLNNKNTITGELNLHQDLETKLFTAAKCSTKWDDIVVDINNATACNNGEKSLELTIGGARPQSFGQQGGDLDSEITYNIPFVASTVTVDTTEGG